MVIEKFNTENYVTNNQHIFLMSHMRANTSLISHILGSHPQINGYYEMHLSYHSNQDLLRQQQVYCSKDDIKSGSQFWFDKILHNDYELQLERLTGNNIIVLVAIRSAEQTLKSIVHLFANKKGHHSYADPELATRYYIDRITTLAQFCRHYPGRYFYYDADLIRTRTEKILERLQQWLALDSPLSQQYQLFSQTGLARAGDSSDNMTKGRIVKGQGNYDNIVIAPDLLQQALIESERHRTAIIANALDSIIL